MEEAVIPITALAMPLILVPTIMHMKHIRQRREWEHAERMKALELGLPIPGVEAWRAAACIAVGAVVPVGAFFFAWIASLTTEAAHSVWESAVAVGITGVLSGTYMSARLLGSRTRPQRTPADAANGKPAVDPDMYDVVGRRG